MLVCEPSTAKVLVARLLCRRERCRFHSPSVLVNETKWKADGIEKNVGM